jgi:hypothetical protein
MTYKSRQASSIGTASWIFRLDVRFVNEELMVVWILEEILDARVNLL